MIPKGALLDAPAGRGTGEILASFARPATLDSCRSVFQFTVIRRPVTSPVMWASTLPDVSNWSMVNVPL